MARFAALPSSHMEAAFGGLHKNGAGGEGAGSILVESILEDGKAANLAMQPTPTPTEGPHATKGFQQVQKQSKEYALQKIKGRWSDGSLSQKRLRNCMHSAAQVGFNCCRQFVINP